VPLLALLVAAFAWGCSQRLAVYVIRQPDAGALVPRAPCEVRVYPFGVAAPAECREVGDVFVGDTAFSTNCGLGRVMSVVQESACQQGADTVQIVREHAEGSYGSSCAQVRARFLTCAAPAVSQ
jgi:hypothetical protein